jgi:hypothetical protein
MPREEILPNCELVWERERGVLYVHNKDTGATVLRICGLDTNTTICPALSEPGNMIDITRPERVGYPEAPMRFARK